MVTPTPPQETAPRLPGRPQGLRPRPLGRVHHAHISQEHRPLTTPGASGPRKAAQSLPDREPSPQSSASPPDCEQPLSTSGKNRPAIFARPTSGPSLGAAPPPETNGQLKCLAGAARGGSPAAPLVTPPPIHHAPASTRQPGTHRQNSPAPRAGATPPKGVSYLATPPSNSGAAGAGTNEGMKLLAKLHLQRRRTGKWLMLLPVRAQWQRPLPFHNRPEGVFGGPRGSFSEGRSSRRPSTMRGDEG